MQELDVRRDHLLESITQVMQRQQFLENFAKNGRRRLGTLAIPMLENTTIVETPDLNASLKFGVTQLILKLNGNSALYLFVLLD